jgi:hypothetical protein
VQPPNRDLDLHALLNVAVLAGAADTSRLAALRDRSWPGGGDRTIPHAHDWLKRWGPRRTLASPPRCACADGRCPVCN